MNWNRTRTMRNLWSRWAGVGCFGLVLAVASGAVAQERQAPRRVIRLEETRIEGRIQKPQAFYILQRYNLNFEGLELKNSFIPKIIESVKEEPF